MDEDLTVGPCVDALTLEALLDNELPSAAVEIVLHHAQTCARCVTLLEELRATRNRAADVLDSEDEADAAWTSAALERTKAAIDAAVERPAATDGRSFLHTWFGRWRVAALAAAAVLLVLAVPVVFPPDAGASVQRIARENILRERAWMSRPNSVRHWVVESEIRNRRGIRDGRYRRELWQRNDAAGRSARISRQVDADNRLLSASWTREDGSMVSWLADRPDEVRVRPSTAQLEASLPALPGHLRRALSAYLDRRQQSAMPQTQQQSFADYLTRVSGLAARAGTFERVRGANGQDLYCVRSDMGFPEAYRPLVRLKQEDFIGARDFRRYRMRTWRYFADGVVETEDARTTYFEETPFDEFERHTLRELMARGVRVVEATPADVALEQVEREKYPPPVPWVDPGARKAITDTTR